MTTNALYKYGIIQQKIANYLCGMNVGDKLETFEKLSKYFNVGRGTIQTAIKELVSIKALKYNNAGRNGRIISYLNYEKLIEIAGETFIIGVMPLPYSKRYEGLATGIFKTLNNSIGNCNLAFMSGSRNRLKALLSGRYDFIVVSKQTANLFLKENLQVVEAKQLYNHSFIKGHVLASHIDINSIDEIKRIGVDFSSDDQTTLTNITFKDYDVELVPIRYSNLTDSIASKKIDGAIWSADNFSIYNDKIKILKTISPTSSMDETIASILCLQNNQATIKFLNMYLDEKTIKSIQNQVIEGSITANY